MIKNTLFFVITFLFQLWIISGAYVTLSANWTIIGIIFCLISFYRPFASLYFLLAIMCIFASRPPDPILHPLIVLSAYWIIGAYMQLFAFNTFTKKRFFAKMQIDSYSKLAVSIFILVTFLSLFSFPMSEIYRHSTGGYTYYVFKEILPAGETTTLYTFQSALFLWQAICIGLFVYASAKRSIQFVLFKNIIYSILAGFLCFVLIGYLDYLKFIDLSWYRPSDGVTVGRFHSFFVNSGWASQYMALTLPFFAILLLLAKDNIKVTSIKIFIFAIIVAATILTMQRGAWLTLPFTIFIFALSCKAILHTKQDYLNIVKKIFYLILLVFVFLIVLNIVLVSYFGQENTLSSIESIRYIQKRADIMLSYKDRLGHWPSAMLMFLEHPIFGNGSDSFGWLYQINFAEAAGKFHNSSANNLEIWQYGTAHNLYLQTLIGKGAVGLISLLAMFFILLVGIVRKIRQFKNANNMDMYIFGLALLGVLVATMLYGNVQEIFYVQQASIIVWIVIFMLLGYIDEKKQKNILFLNIKKTSLLAVCLLFVIHLFSYEQFGNLFKQELGIISQKIKNKIIS